ncbi:MAG: hypothetical protein SNJ52_00165 [Verrucomicrobiia bacterium]
MKLSAQNLTRWIIVAISDSRVKAACREAASRAAEEDGVSLALREIEAAFSGTRNTQPPLSRGVELVNS